MLHSVQLVKLLQSRGKKLALAESMTCGEAAGRLASVQGTSDILLCSIVCYHESAKTSLLKINPRILKKHTAESQQATDAMVKNLKKLIKADVYAAITGLASAGGSESKRKPVGTVFFAVIAGKNCIAPGRNSMDRLQRSGGKHASFFTRRSSHLFVNSIQTEAQHSVSIRQVK